MKAITDTRRILGLGVLLTLLSIIAFVSLEAITRCVEIRFPGTQYRQWIDGFSWVFWPFLVYILPLMFAYLAGRGSIKHPVRDGILTCCIPAVVYFLFRYGWNVSIRLDFPDGFIHMPGFEEPSDVVGNLKMAFRIMWRPLFMGALGGAIGRVYRPARTSE